MNKERLDINTSHSVLVQEILKVKEHIDIEGKKTELVAKYFYLLGRIRFKENNFDESTKAFTQCNFTNSKFTYEIMYWYARMCEIEGKISDAKMYYKFALEKYYDNNDLMTKDEILTALNQISDTKNIIIDFKHYAHLKESKHDEIITFFKKHELGSSNPIMTYLSILSPLDRCIILEQLFIPNLLNSWDLRDKMVLAYVKTGRVELAKEVIEYSYKNGESSINLNILKSKIDLGVPPAMSDLQRLEIINREYDKEKGNLEKQFLQLISKFITNNNKQTPENSHNSSNEELIEITIAKNIVAKIESKFNTKVLRFGIEEKGTKDYQAHIPFYVSPPHDTELIFWFLIPLDEDDFIIKNDYYKYVEYIKNGNRYSAQYYEETLKNDWELTNYLEELLDCQIYDTGGIKIKTYLPTDNSVSNVAVIENITYRYFRFFSPRGL